MSHTFARSDASYLTRRRLQTELELKVIRKRLKAEMGVEAQLVELKRLFSDEKCQLVEQRRERVVDEDMAQLRLVEGIDRRFSEPGQPPPYDYESEPDGDAILDRPLRQGRSQLTQPYRTARHEDWIDRLKLRRTARSMGPAKFVRNLSIATPGSGRYSFPVPSPQSSG